MTVCPFEIESGWEAVLKEELAQAYMHSLAAFVESERLQKHLVYPPQELVFNAFSKTPYHGVKVVIMGQDPYHGPGQAHGLSFSVPRGIAPPPSLKNIFKELQADLSIPIAAHGCLNKWAEQGVLLLNATLTVRQGEPLSHHGQGWEQFTAAVINKLCMRKDPVIFVLWGKSAQEKGKQVLEAKSQHIVLQAPHPSPFSAHQGFFGCRHFSKINEHLVALGSDPINWSIN